MSPCLRKTAAKVFLALDSWLLVLVDTITVYASKIIVTFCIN
jgi:hypothetical protein